MKEKSPKSPILVLATMIFLAMFIILPPVFRLAFPAEEVVEEKEKVITSLFCERVSISEMKKITTKITYEDGVPVKNVITYIEYTPTEEDKNNDTDNMADMTVAAELLYFKGINGIDILEKASQTVITVTDDNVVNNPQEVELTKYLSEREVALANYEAQGYSCTKTDS